MDEDEKTGDASAFADALADLKERGSLLLLTGTAAESRRAACQRLLGDAGAGPRRRLFVDIEGGTAASTPTGRAGARRVRYRTATRSAAAVQGGGEPGPDANARLVSGGLTELRRVVVEEVESLGGDDAEASSVRVCLRGADALVAAHGEAQAEEFFRGLRDVARSVGGMFHVHLPVATDADAADALAPAFDAVIETRADDPSQQRWHLRDPELTTAWLTL